jgi:hypothetical protein
MAFGDIVLGNDVNSVTLDTIGGDAKKFDLHLRDVPNTTNAAIAEAESLGGDVDRLFGELEQRAEASAKDAEAAIKAALRFKPNFDSVNSTTPSFSEPDFQDGTYGDAPSPEKYTAPEAAQPFRVKSLDGNFTEQSTTAPPDAELKFQPPSPMGATSGAPSAPGSATVSVNGAPTFDVVVEDAPALPELPALVNVEIITKYQPIKTTNFPPINSSELERAATRLSTALSLSSLTLPNYSYHIPLVFDAVGSLLSSTGIQTDDILVDAHTITEPHTTRLHAMWSKRRHDAPEVSAYTHLMRDKLTARVDRSNTIQQAKWTAEALITGMELGVAAHSMLIDIESSIYDMRFQANMMQAEAQLELAKAAVSIYNANVSIYAAEAEVYNGELAKLSADVEKYKSEMALEELKGRVNTSRSEAFSAEERSKGVQAALYDAKIKVQAAKVQAYAASLRSLAGQVMQQEAAVEQYKAGVIAWEAELKRIAMDYDMYSTKTKGIVAQMRGEAVKQSVTVANNRALEAKVQIQAARIGVKAAKIKAELTAKTAEHTHIIEQNSAISAGYNVTVADYAAQVARWSVGYKQRAAAFEGTQLYMNAAQSYMTRSTESYARAARLTQQVGTQVTTAQAQLAETAGRAGAAIEQGRLAGFRASKSASAGASISGDRSWSLSKSSSSSFSAGYGESVQESISA